VNIRYRKLTGQVRHKGKRDALLIDPDIEEPFIKGENRQGGRGIYHKL